jgi:histidinol dehydrogenase
MTTAIEAMPPFSIRQFRSGDSGFSAYLKAHAVAGVDSTTEVEPAVRAILEDVRTRGLPAVLEYTLKFDGVQLDHATIEVARAERETALRAVSSVQLKALRDAAKRIRAYQKKLVPRAWMRRSGDEILGQLVIPMDRVGIYVPGGKAVYPSSVLMNAIPARIAGVPEIIMVTPPGRDGINPLVLAAAEVAEVDRVFRVGGAQAVGALAYGAGLPRVDKIVGPGNKYVAAAKRLVFGTVSIDMIAGPSEILVLADDTANPDWVATDLLSQAEHDEDAISRFVSWSPGMCDRVRASLEKISAQLSRVGIARQSLARHGLLVETATRDEAIELANQFAAEHLELCCDDAEEILPRIRHAGAIFLGHYTPEAVGDYVAGPNHVLPTGGTARFSSPLGPYDFIKRSSVIGFGPAALAKQARTITTLADAEGLTAHGDSVRIRQKAKKG